MYIPITIPISNWKSGIPHTHTQSIQEFPVKTEMSSDNTHGGEFICHLDLPIFNKYAFQYGISSLGFRSVFVFSFSLKPNEEAKVYGKYLKRRTQSSNKVNIAKRIWHSLISFPPIMLWIQQPMENRGPFNLQPLTMFSITVVTQPFASHLANLDLTAISIVCGQAYDTEQHRMLGVYL